VWPWVYGLGLEDPCCSFYLEGRGLGLDLSFEGPGLGLDFGLDYITEYSGRNTLKPTWQDFSALNFDIFGFTGVIIVVLNTQV
jgi:hypothetical protein